MNSNQIYNLLYYMEIMWGQEWLKTSPDYFKEKTMLFFNRLGKNEFIEYPFNWMYSSLLEYFDINSSVFKSLSFEEPFKVDGWWNKYCETWKVDINNYELMNIINFIVCYKENIEIKPENTRKIFQHIEKNFIKYIGDIEQISDKNLNAFVHAKIRLNIEKRFNLNDRYLKLKTINK